VDAALDLSEIDGLLAQRGPELPALEGLLNVGELDAGAADRDGVVVVASARVGDDGDELVRCPYRTSALSVSSRRNRNRRGRPSRSTNCHASA
jgi:hypothetical protein